MAAETSYRPYDPSLNLEPIEYLDDADEYYQDILESLNGMTEVSVFITGWLIRPEVQLRAGQTLEQTLATLLKDPKSTCYILWNSSTTGPNPGLIPRIEKFRTNVKLLSGVTDIDAKLKIIISVDAAFDPGWKLTVAGKPSNFFPFMPSALEQDTIRQVLWTQARDIWQNQFNQSNPGKYRNLTEFVVGSHHQKTITLAGKKNGESVLIGYCGIDPTVAGGATWHDGGMRVSSDMALGLLNNFIERWNCELNDLEKIVSFGIASKTETLAADQFYVAIGHPKAGAITTRRTLPKRIDNIDQKGFIHYVSDTASCWPWKKEIRQDYLDLIGSARQWLFIENQYFRHPEITTAVKQALDAQTSLHVTIVIPSFSEEIGDRADCFYLRDQYVAATTQTEKNSLLAQAREKANLIHPFNKVTLLLQAQCLADLVTHPRARIWFPHGRTAGGRVGMPYIHTKLIIVDDTALYIGSANLNGRSLDGFADSEINLLLTDQAIIDRIMNRIKWQNEPDSETDSRYRNWIAGDTHLTYYAKHNLVRYRQAHWEIDNAFGTFPTGKAALVDYWRKFTGMASKRESTWTPQLTPIEFGRKLDSLPGSINLDTFDWGSFLIENTVHFL